jgi:hypothetical protein
MIVLFEEIIDILKEGIDPMIKGTGNDTMILV